MAEATAVRRRRIDNTACLLNLRVDSMAVNSLRNHLSARAEIQAPCDASKGASEMCEKYFSYIGCVKVLFRVLRKFARHSPWSMRYICAVHFSVT
jgi:hypothetical protein